MLSLALPTDTAPLVKGPPQGQWTFTDWEQLPDDDNVYEIINGVLYVSTAPRYFHQFINFNLTRLVGVPAFEQHLAHAAYAPIGLIMPGCDPVQPDFLLVKWERADIIHDGRVYGVPDLIVEILSPGTRNYDETVKLQAYAEAGVPEVALVDPASRELFSYRLDVPGKYRPVQVFGEADTAHFSCVPTLQFLVRDLFAGAPDTTLK
jgi:Uma2 family endonuclease